MPPPLEEQKHGIFDDMSFWLSQKVPDRRALEARILVGQHTPML